MFIRTKEKRSKGGRVLRYYELCTNVRRKGKDPQLVFIQHLGKKVPSKKVLNAICEKWKGG